MFSELSDEYKTCSLHIALERADNNKDWKSFKIIYDSNPEYLKNHLDMTKYIFDYNYTKLSREQKQYIFSI